MTPRKCTVKDATGDSGCMLNESRAHAHDDKPATNLPAPLLSAPGGSPAQLQSLDLDESSSTDALRAPCVSSALGLQRAREDEQHDTCYTTHTERGLAPTVYLGVAQVWVHADWRRRGVARKLLDCARAHAVPGMVVPPAQLAFSQPTTSGWQLAAAYTRSQFIWLY